ncbi:MAG TPA: hypothetical protein VK733_03585 [Gemmatimonadaceae bacterium]|jgi:hypothetical protein|nr:hypothetical protein [Gemmatimonadaceae bacterium]
MAADPNDRLISVDASTLKFQYIVLTVTVSVIVVIGILAWIPGTLDRFIDPESWWFKTFPMLGVIVGLLGRVSLGTMCTVHLTPYGLRFTRGGTEILVPMTLVKQVDWVRPDSDDTADGTRTITIWFRERTPFGTSIQFLAPTQGDVSPRDLVDELRRRAGFLPSGQSWS